MATITEIREKLRNGEIVIMPGRFVGLFMQECQQHPVGDEHYVIKPHSKGYSSIYDPARAREAL